jgi:hypothetical protein
MKRAETPAEKLIRYRQAYDKVVNPAKDRIDAAVHLLAKREEDIQNEVTVILERLLDTGFIDCEVSKCNELVIEVSPCNRDPLDKASAIMQATGFKMLRFVIGHDVMEVEEGE